MEAAPAKKRAAGKKAVKAEEAPAPKAEEAPKKRAPPQKGREGRGDPGGRGGNARRVKGAAAGIALRSMKGTLAAEAVGRTTGIGRRGKKSPSSAA